MEKWRLWNASAKTATGSHRCRISWRWTSSFSSWCFVCLQLSNSQRAIALQRPRWTRRQASFFASTNEVLQAELSCYTGSQIRSRSPGGQQLSMLCVRPLQRASRSRNLVWSRPTHWMAEKKAQVHWAQTVTQYFLRCTWWSQTHATPLWPSFVGLLVLHCACATQRQNPNRTHTMVGRNKAHPAWTLWWSSYAVALGCQCGAWRSWRPCSAQIRFCDFMQHATISCSTTWTWSLLASHNNVPYWRQYHVDSAGWSIDALHWPYRDPAPVAAEMHALTGPSWLWPCATAWRPPRSDSSATMGRTHPAVQAQEAQESWRQHWLQRSHHQGGPDKVSAGVLGSWCGTASRSTGSTPSAIHVLPAHTASGQRQESLRDAWSLATSNAEAPMQADHQRNQT